MKLIHRLVPPLHAFYAASHRKFQAALLIILGTALDQGLIHGELRARLQFVVVVLGALTVQAAQNVPLHAPGE